MLRYQLLIAIYLRFADRERKMLKKLKILARIIENGSCEECGGNRAGRLRYRPVAMCIDCKHKKNS